MEMSTQRQQAQYKRIAETPSQPTETPPRAPTTGRRKWRWLAGGGVLLVLVWLLPSVIAHTPLVGWGISMAAADLKGTVSVRSVSLGWFSPIAAEGIEVRDAKGQPLLQAASLTGDKSLLSLLGNLSALGKMKLDKPKLIIDVRADGSNLEDALAKYLAPTDKPNSRVGMELDVVDGTVTLNDQVNNRSWSIEKFQFSLAMSADPQKPIEIKTSATVSDLQRAANFDLALLLEADMSGECTLNSNGLPLAMCDAVLKRAVPRSSISGRLMAQLKGRWSAAGRTDIQGRLSTTEFEFKAPAMGTDRLAFDRFELTCRAAGQNNVYIIDASTLDCDLGKLTVSGNLDLTRRADTSWSDAMLAQDYEVKGSLDLARLAAMLPGTLRVREGTRINSGRAEVNLLSRKTAQGMVWHAGIDTADLRAAGQAGEFAWAKPIALAVDAHQVPQGIVIDELKCEADFLSIEAKGTPDDLTATASFNLKTLDEQLGKFVNLDDLQLTGDGWGRLTWKHAADSRFDAKLELKVDNFQYCLPGKAPWAERTLMAVAEAKGKADPTNFKATARIDGATANIRTAVDKIDIELTQPVASMAADKWPLQVEMSGQIEPWLARLGAWFPLEGWRAAGAYEVKAACLGSSQGVEISDARVLIAPLQVASASVAINEPRVEIAAAGGWNRAKQTLTLEPFSLASNTIAVEGKKVALNMSATDRTELGGTVTYKADLARLVQWFVDPAKPREWNVTGALAGSLGFQPATFGTDAALDAEIANLSVVTAGNQPAVEPRVKLSAKANYNHKSGLIELGKAEIVSQAIAAAFAGRVEPGEKQRNLVLQGNVGCDWNALCGLARPWIGNRIQFVGRSSAPASLEGPVDLATARGAAAAQWQSANIYGFPLGPAQANMKLYDGFARVEPLELAVSKGRVTLAPAVRMSTPYELFLPPGKLADHVQITRPMCDAALMYIAPVLANVADARGAFSIELDTCRIPLTDPAKGDIGGRFIVHDIEVGASPLVQALVSLFGRISPGKLQREAVVPFRMVEGRVYHQDLELIFPEITIRTHGSVGIDQTMQILAEMPVPQKWIDAMGKTALADSMRGQTISIPVGGTLTKPQLDQRVVDQLSKKFLRQATENVIEGEINKGINQGLDRLFGPRK